MILITPQETINIAFQGLSDINADLICESKINAAQYKFIRPVVGSDMYRCLMLGEYSDFVHTYIKPALAYFVRYTVLPDISLQVGNAGIMQYSGQYSSAATDKQRETLRAQALDDGNTLLNEAVDELKSNPTLYPKYHPEISGRNKQAVIRGGIILN